MQAARLILQQSEQWDVWSKGLKSETNETVEIDQAVHEGDLGIGEAEDINVYEQELKSFHSIYPEMAAFMNNMQKQVEQTLNNNLAEIRSAFNKKLVKLFMPRTIVDFETLFKDCHERISQAFQE